MPVSATSSRSSLEASGPGIDDAAAGIDDRLFRREDEVCRRLDPVEVALHPRMIALALNGGGRRVHAFGELHVLWNIDNDRAGAAGGGDVEGFVQDARQVIDVADQPIVLGAGAGDADRVAFLERVGADQKGGDLAGEADQAELNPSARPAAASRHWSRRGRR